MARAPASPPTPSPRLKRRVKRKPDSPVALLNLADALTQAGQTSRAAATLSHALKVAPGRPAALVSARQSLNPLRSTKPQPSPHSKRRSRSIRDFAEAHNLLGAALAGRGDLDRAEKELLRALQLNPDFPDALGNLGHLLAARRDPAQAAFYFARSVQLKPNDAEVRTNYAVTLAALNRLDEARQQIEAAVKADPKSPDAHNVKGSSAGAGRESRRRAARIPGSHPPAPGFRHRPDPRRPASSLPVATAPPPNSNCARRQPAPTPTSAGRPPRRSASWAAR